MHLGYLVSNGDRNTGRRERCGYEHQRLFLYHIYNATTCNHTSLFRMPSVRFDPSVDKAQTSQKRRRNTQSNIDQDDPSEQAPSKKPKRYRPNEDELDDIDDWKEDEDTENADKDLAVPSEKELLEAKRQRRQSRAGLDAEDSTRIDEMTSLASEGIAIEPFHMKNEESDGTGYFDGDTYIFRRNNTEEGVDEEPDAWLDRLREEEEQGSTQSQYQGPPIKSKPTESIAQESLDDLSKEDLYNKILPLIQERESVSQALIRYGKLIKPVRGAKGAPITSTPSTSQNSAKTNLNELTGAANALLLQGEVEIYQYTKQDILKSLPASSTKNPRQKQPPAQWEYQGNQDGALHGPYTTEQMLAWVKAGYFVGDQRVKIRTLRDDDTKSSMQDDLLADLLDDDDEDTKKKATTKGEWQWSNEVDFCAYLVADPKS